MNLYVHRPSQRLRLRRRTSRPPRPARPRSGDKPDSGMRWIRSYVAAEESGELGTFCIYEADSPEAIRAHAAAADLPVDEIVPIADTVVVRPDPSPVAA